MGTFDNSLNTINQNNNYIYDEEGRLIQDLQEGIDKIEWMVTGKVKTVERINGFSKTVGGNPFYPSDLEFKYDALGNRIAKIEKPRNQNNGNLLPSADWKTTFYVRDAQGNVLSVYKQSFDAQMQTASYKLTEKHIYGSSRVGMETTQTEMIGAQAPSTTNFTHTLGNKQMEMGNHLGNVLAVVTDKKIPVDVNNDLTVDYYKADLLVSTDYSPFGVPLNGRDFMSEKYRYGFNGQEKVDEVAGKGNHNTAPFWEYSPRLGRRWNRDPKPNSSLSDYNCFANNPIWFSDPLGDIFDIGKTEQSIKDVKSLVKPESEKYITINDGHIGLDFTGLDETTKAELFKKDEGLKLINDLVSSDKKYLYEASDVVLIRDEQGNKTAGFMYKRPHQIINASEGGKDSDNKHTDRPREEYQGQVIIHPDAKFEEKDVYGTVLKKPRSSLVFHELTENYERTQNNIDYVGTKGAHELAKDREIKWQGKSQMPGEVTKIIPAGKPNKERLKEIGEIIKDYYGY